MHCLILNMLWEFIATLCYTFTHMMNFYAEFTSHHYISCILFVYIFWKILPC